MRGLDYYTQTAFEVIMNKVGSQQNAICGGGRYNKLVSQIGGDDVPGVGFAAGMERVLLTVAEEGIELPVDTAIDVYVAPLGDAAKEVCFKLTHALRQKGLKVETDYLSKSMKAQMKAADKNHARYTIIVGDDELAQGVCVVRDMAQSTQENVALDNVLDFIK